MRIPLRLLGQFSLALFFYAIVCLQVFAGFPTSSAIAKDTASIPMPPNTYVDKYFPQGSNDYLLIRHDANIARKEAETVMQLLYGHRDPSSVYEHLSEEFKSIASVAMIAQLLENKEKVSGKMKGFKGEAYGPVVGQKAINIFLTSSNDQATLYHRIFLTGDGSRYKVSGIFFADQPYPKEFFRWDFKTIDK